MIWIEFLQHLSLLIGIGVAIYGVDSWRREHSGRRQIELAEDALALFYEAADAIRHIRHPASFGHELEGIERGENESAAEFSARKNASIVFVRYNKHQETFNKLHAMRYRFMAQIGKDQAKAFEDLRAIIDSLTHSASMLARLWPRERFSTDGGWDAHQANVAKYEAIFWEGLPDDDPINPKVAAVIAEIESVCRSVIAGKGTIYGMLNRQFGRSKQFTARQRPRSRREI